MGRRTAWTDAVLAPVRPEEVGGLAALDRLPDRLATVTAGQPRWHELVVTLPALRRSLDPAIASSVGEEPFRWKPAFVRRSLGLAAIDACLRGRYRSPAEAVPPVADDAVAAWQRSGWRTFHWEPWMSYLPTGARAVVLAEASRWATALWCAFDWSALVPRVRLGRTDDQWRCPPGGVRLRARSDLRVTVPVDRQQPGPRVRTTWEPDERAEVLVVTSVGAPTDTWDVDLAFPALVSVLVRPQRRAPGRVVGIWPEVGELRAVEIDAACLARTAHRVVDGVAAMVGGLGTGPYLPGPSAIAARSSRAAFPSGLPAAVSGISSTSSS